MSHTPRSAWAATLGSLGIAVVILGLAPAPENQPIPAPTPASGGSSNAPEWASVRAILENNCLRCHGGEKRESDLSFADSASFAQGGARGPAIDRDHPAQSRLLQVISYSDPNLAMPPSGKLSDENLDILTRWILAGAPWPQDQARGQLADPALHPQHHKTIDFDSDWWSYQPLAPVQIPDHNGSQWAKGPIDALIEARLSEQGLEPAPPASAQQLLRRARYDLTGLPPTLEEVERFTGAYAQDPDGAWEALIDELLDSPQYGEHWARFWLDQVRYAQTNGYERDGTKPNIWRYRDWVIRAFNADMPYDEFLLQQLAGDELLAARPDRYADDSPLIATGFYRLGVWDDEPADPVQARADELADIVDTTGQLVLGMTMGCARCHDHKADPISQKDYYAFTAYFSNITSYGNNSRNTRMAESVAMVADAAPEGHLDADEAQQRIAELRRLIAQTTAAVDWARSELEPIVTDARDGGGLWRYKEGPFPDDAHLQAFDDASWPQARGGFGSKGTPGAIIGAEWKSKKITIRQDFRLGRIPEGLVLSIHHDEDARVFINGQLVAHLTGYSTNYRHIQLGRDAINALVVGSNTIALMCEQTRGGQYIDAGLHEGWLDTAEAIVHRVEHEAKNADAPQRVRAAGAYVQQIRQIERTPVNEPYEALVVQEKGTTPEPQHILMRGSAHAPGDEVAPAIPTVLSWAGKPDMPESGLIHASSGRRLALARWLVGKGDAITARVMANKLWQSHFGRGLARASGDFGKLGQQPTHPQLLEHLAAQLIERGWSLKDMHRTIMRSSAYRMASTPSDLAQARDPLNNHYQHADPRRLTAEQYRDAVLSVSGQANNAMYGPSVYPVMAPEVLATASKPDEAWGASSPDEANRRSVYVFAKRSLRLPLFESLDQPSPDLPCLNRFSTNVPTQALITLNGEFVNESASRFAQRLLEETDTLDEAIARGITLAFGRHAPDHEIERHRAFIESMRRKHTLDEPEALRLFCLVLFNTNEFMWLD